MPFRLFMALAGCVVGLLASDWLRLRQERDHWAPLAIKAAALAEEQRTTAQVCLNELADVRKNITTDAGRQRLVNLQQAEFESTLKEREQEQKKARKQLKELSNIIKTSEE